MGSDTPLSRATQLVEESNRAAGSAERIKIGLLTPLTDTGWVVAGEMITRGACLAAEYVRERGGIDGGKQIEFVIENDQATATYEPMWRSAVGGMAKLAIVDKVLAVLGQWMVRTTPWVAETCEHLGVPHFVTTGHPEVTARQYRTAFRTFYTTTERAELMVRFMKEQGARRIAIIAANSLFGKYFADSVQALASAAPSPCEVLRFDFDAVEARQVHDELRQIKAWKPDFFVNLGIMVQMDAHQITNQASEVGLLPSVPMLVGIPFPSVSADFWRRVGANGNFVVWPSSQFLPGWPGLTPTGRWFVDRYMAKYRAFPSDMALTGFTDVTIIAQALARARSISRDGLLEALETGSFDSWRGPICFKRNSDHWHHSPPKIQLLQYQRVGESLEDAAIVYPAELKTRDYVSPKAAVVA
jgi:branched-chain amino acid transport system substrate-binding protein